MGSATQKRMPRKQSHGLVTMDISVWSVFDYYQEGSDGEASTSLREL
jgi:hypothetical protein